MQFASEGAGDHPCFGKTISHLLVYLHSTSIINAAETTLCHFNIKEWLQSVQTKLLV